MNLHFDRPLDLERMCRQRHARFVEQMHAHGVDVAVLAAPSAVAYATGAVTPAADAGRSAHRRAVAVVTADGSPPELFTPCPDGVPPGHDRSHVHRALDLEWADDAHSLAGELPSGRLAIDDCTMPLRAALGERELVDAATVVSAAKVVKTADEIECIRRAQAINEAAITAVVPLVEPGVKATELSGRLLQSLFDLGASSNTVDPIWQVMGRIASERPMSITGDLVFPTPTQARELVSGDLIWADNGVNYSGYQSDYGNAWIVGREPNAREREHYQVWRAILDAALGALRAGATCADLTAAATRAAADAAGRPDGASFGRRPWLAHLYLAHGTGTESAELPYVGTDLGADFDASFELEPGMVLVFEPITWEDGVGGFRAEEIVAVTDDGYELLSHVDVEGWS